MEQVTPPAVGVIFTCTRDAAAALVAARQLLALGVPPTLAVDDAERATFPAPPEGVRLVFTSWRRRGNLNGAEAVRGIHETMKAEAVRVGARWAIKADSDTLIRPAFVAALADPAPLAVSTRYPYKGTWQLAGAAYALTVAAIDAMAPARALLNDATVMPEDGATFKMVRGCGLAHRDLGPLAWWHHEHARFEYAPADAAAATFGWISSFPAAVPVADRRAAVAQVMESNRDPVPAV